MRPQLTINTNCVGHPAINLPPLSGGITPNFSSPVNNIGNQWSNGFQSPSPAPIPMNTMLQPPMALNHLLNLQNPQLLTRHSISPPGGSSSASTTGSTGSSGYGSGHTHITMSLASDTKDGNGNYNSSFFLGQ